MSANGIGMYALFGTRVGSDVCLLTVVQWVCILSEERRASGLLLIP